MQAHEQPEKLAIPFWRPGTYLLLALMLTAAAFAAARFTQGLSFSTNLDNAYPWGLWIAVDVATGVALAAGGFTTAALVYVMGRKKYHSIIRPALLTAWLGYAFVGAALLVDLGRYYFIWHPIIYWQGNSVLFEVGMCVMVYLTVLTIEFAPVVIEGIRQHVDKTSRTAGVLRAIEPPLSKLRTGLNVIMPVFIIAGIVLSCMHQSSLGSLMLIAPYKLHPLWYTPILPLLFLSSAIAVGLPMVMFESLCASRAFRRKPEMHLLGGLGRYALVLLLIYAILKLGDMLIRGTGVYLFDGSTDSRAFLVEVLFGVLLPIILLAIPSVRRSPGGLFLASCLIIGGVVLNRINVFLVGYHPPYATHGYFPSISEIGITVGFVSTVIFCYRVFLAWCPIMPAGEAQDPTLEPQRVRKGAAVGTVTVLAMLLLPVTAARAEQPMIQPAEAGPAISNAPALWMLDSPLLKRFGDDYDPVRFMHRKHANIASGDCTVCHHRVPQSPDDRIGLPVTFEQLGGRSLTGCRQCHRLPAEPEHVLRPGLKGAYHQSCIDCHVRRAAGPTDCTSCHRPHVPSHESRIELTGDVTAQQVTAECLRCHEQQGHDILKTAHWTWTGRSPDTLGHENDNDLGKRNIINNYCLHVASNWPRCTSCHIGYGWKDMSFDFDDPGNIDCLVCHDTTGTYKKYPTAAGLPVLKQDYPDGREWPPKSGTMMPPVDLVNIAKHVGRSSRATCGVCHFNGGGGDGVKHGDMDSTLIDPPPEHDVHMGKYDFSCTDCHRSVAHQISGACNGTPAREGRVTCEQCHTHRPHVGPGLLNAHLDDHCRTIACQTCHIPVFAKGKPTKLYWDWSQGGLDKTTTQDEYGKPTWLKEKGDFVWGKNVQPEYAWSNGKHERYVLPEIIDPEQTLHMNPPLGNINDPTARVFPYKIHRGRQIYDSVNNYLVVPNVFGGFWDKWDWGEAAKDGMKAAGLPYSGEYGFVDTTMHWAINHEVVPSGQALSCVQCHTANQAVNCSRCHQNASPSMRPALGRVYEAMNTAGRPRANMDFHKLGYNGDPAETGGRFSRLSGSPAVGSNTQRVKVTPKGQPGGSE